MAINYEKPCNVRIALFTLDGKMLDVTAKNVGERRSYERLAKENFALTPSKDQVGVVVVVDYEKNEATVEWSKRGYSLVVQKQIDAWLEKQGLRTVTNKRTKGKGT